uniref:Leptin receptor immunoglobulin-like domain-containing protein n=1 Tax=Zonotrichia albicollis TaxID=44394 RepID=A0A8D2MXB7_ZONAL
MCWQIIPTVLVLMGFLQMAAAHCMVHPVPARNFTLPCVLLNQTFLSPFSAGSWSGLGRELGAPKIKHFMNEENFLCCLWSASDFDCSLYRASMQARKFIPSEINLSAPQKIDWSWNMECWIRGRLDLLVCNLQLLKLDLRDDLKVNLLYSGSELSLGAASTSSLQGTVRVAPCDCRDRASCQCLASQGLNTGEKQGLGSLALSEEWNPAFPTSSPWEYPNCPFSLSWTPPFPASFPYLEICLQYHPLEGWECLGNPSQMLQVALESSMAVDNALLDSPCSVQVRSRNLRAPGFWSDWSSPYNLSVGGRTVWDTCRPGDKADFPAGLWILCWELSWDGRSCGSLSCLRLNMNFNISCETDGYQTKMTCRWSANPTTLLLGTLQLRYHRSQIYCSDFPSPSPDSEVKECLLQGNHSYECTFQPIFLLSGYTLWIEFKHSLGTLQSSPTCVIPADVGRSRSFPCAPEFLNAPLRGPEFWRVVSEDAAGKQRNVTLLWKPLMQNDSLCSVSRYIIKHQSPGSPPWEEFVDHGTSWTFPWMEPTHTVTILAMNSLGISAINSNLTLSQQMSTVDAVQSLSAYLVNSTCVVVVWSLSPQTPGIKSFVIEWRNLNKEEQVKWLRVPPDLRKYFIYDHFILIEKYQFSLYPVFAGGVGKARATDQFAQGGFETGNSGSLHVVLPIVFSTSVLLLGALLLSHQRMKKLLWEDVPNPKNCSWAQGVNFQQPETLEHLFAKHPEPMSCEPLLLEAEMVLEDISITKTLGKEEPGDFLGTDSPQDSECDSACSSSSFQSSSFCRSCQHGAAVARGGLRYASSCPSSGLRRPKSCPGSCLGSCFLGQHPRVLGAFCRGAWEAGRGAVLLHRALSLLSPEMLSGPLGEAERSLCYLGVAATDTGHRDSLTDTPGATGLLTEHELLQHIPNRATELSQGSLRPKGAVPYVPQFRMAAAKGQEAAEKK